MTTNTVSSPQSPSGNETFDGRWRNLIPRKETPIIREPDLPPTGFIFRRERSPLPRTDQSNSMNVLGHRRVPEMHQYKREHPAGLSHCRVFCIDRLVTTDC